MFLFKSGKWYFKLFHIYDVMWCDSRYRQGSFCFAQRNDKIILFSKRLQDPFLKGKPQGCLMPKQTHSTSFSNFGLHLCYCALKKARMWGHRDIFQRVSSWAASSTGKYHFPVILTFLHCHQNKFLQLDIVCRQQCSLVYGPMEVTTHAKEKHSQIIQDLH